MVELWKAGYAMDTERTHPSYLFKRPARDVVTPGIEALSREEEAPVRDRRLLCKTCGHFITSSGRAVERSGSHIHVFSNPAGMTFRIGCFSSAPGCLTTGAATTEYTWFPGCAWSFALCGACMSHLGWFYESGSSGFYGLILDSLVEDFLQ